MKSPPSLYHDLTGVNEPPVRLERNGEVRRVSVMLIGTGLVRTVVLSSSRQTRVRVIALKSMTNCILLK